MIKFVCFLGIPYQAYKSYKIIYGLTQQNNNLSTVFQETLTMLNYWVIFSILAIFILLFDGIVYYFPFINEILFIFIFGIQTFPRLPELIIQKYIKLIIDPFIPIIDDWLDKVKISPIVFFINFINKIKNLILLSTILRTDAKPSSSNNLLLPPVDNQHKKKKLRIKLRKRN